MPEEHTADLIGGRLHIKHHAHALADAGIRLAQLQHDGTGEILVAQIGKAVVLSDIDHAAQILNQASVGIIGSRLVKKAAAIGIGIQHNLHGINDRRLSASGMPRKKVDPVVKGQGSVFYVMPVVQADPGQGFKSLILHLPLLLRGMSQAARAHRLPSELH